MKRIKKERNEGEPTTQEIREIIVFNVKRITGQLGNEVENQIREDQEARERERLEQSQALGRRGEQLEGHSRQPSEETTQSPTDAPESPEEQQSEQTTTGNNQSESVPKNNNSSENRSPQEIMRVMQQEIANRRRTNQVLQGAVDDSDATLCEELVGKNNTLSTATGEVNQERLNQLDPAIQQEVRDFESGHVARDIKQSGETFFNALSNFFSPGNFYLNQAQIEIKRNNAFIEQLQERINSLNGH